MNDTNNTLKETKEDINYHIERYQMGMTTTREFLLHMVDIYMAKAQLLPDSEVEE